MSVQSMDPDNLDELHWQILSLMERGRDDGEPWGYATIRYLADETGESRQLISQRLNDLVMGDAVDKVTRGFYRLEPEEVPRRE
ncbi:replication/maintenance protein RepL [Halomarina rubra]|uniref:Replication/maintenance protein RepL n=1 Tax=Halomarina rubra TaxID=2071873 RepID=A0ABD6B0T7_9EURY|nr:replication/maintenance protein RepL [Halomarina rubra]